MRALLALILTGCLMGESAMEGAEELDVTHDATAEAAAVGEPKGPLGHCQGRPRELKLKLPLECR